MRVFAPFDPGNPNPLTRIWVKSWRDAGWRPKILMPGESAKRRPGRGKFRVITLSDINTGLRPGGRRTRLNVTKYPPGSTEDSVFGHA